MGDYDQEGFINWLAAGSPLYQEGAGTGATNMVPQTPVAPIAPAFDVADEAWKTQKNLNTGFKYTPQQLGWAGSEAARFAQAGITALPAWFKKDLIMSDQFRLGGKDPIQNFIDLYNTPVAQASQQWGASKDANQYFSGLGVSPDDPDFKEAYIRSAFGTMNNARDSWWDRNHGMVMGLGSVASVIGAAGLGSAFGPAVAGAEAGAGAAGGMTAAEASAMLGESAAGYGVGGASGAAGTVGAAGSIGGNVMGFNNMTPFATGVTAEAGSGAGGLYGTGATLSNTGGAGGLYGTGIGAADLGGYSVGAGGLFGTGVGGSEVLGSAGAGSAGSSSSGLLSNLFSTGSSAMSSGNWWDSLIGVGGAVAGGLLGYNSQQDAIDAAKDNSKDSIAFQKYMYDEALKNYAPFRQVGIDALPGLVSSDPTGGAGQYTEALKNYGTNFKFDTANPAYTQQLAETTRINDQNLAARGMFNSRAGLNLQDQSQRNLVSSEFEKQYSRGYTNLMDMFNMSSKTGATNYNKLLDLTKIGTGAASSAGNAATGLGNSVSSAYGQLANQNLAAGQSSSDLWSGLGAMPMNYMILQNMLGGK